MNKKLQKQIKVYAGVAGALLSAGKIEAQVIYHDIVPDDTVGLNYLFQAAFDIDGDGYPNFFCEFRKYSYPTCGSCSTTCSGHFLIFHALDVIILNDINKLGEITGFGPSIQKLAPGDTISQNLNWDYGADFGGTMTGVCAFPFYMAQVPWPLQSEGCLPLQIKLNGNTRYGWLRCERIDTLAIVFKDFAYQLQPNVPILACDTTNFATGISEYNHQQFYFSQQNNSIHISTPQKLNHANISVYDLLGKEILQEPFDGKETTITLDKKGIYFVEVKSEKGVFRKKVFIY